MSAALSATCVCGRSIVASCPTLDESDWTAAHDAVAAAGFVWREGLGYRCNHWPACSPIPPAPAAPADGQGSLFPDMPA